MRFVFDNRDEAKRRGYAARQYMLNHYSLEVMGQVLKAEFKRIQNKLKSGKQKSNKKSSEL